MNDGAKSAGTTDRRDYRGVPREAGGVDVATQRSSVRIDDLLQPALSRGHVIRILPFGGRITRAAMDARS